MQKHIEPPANLPVVPSTPASEAAPSRCAEPEEAEGFRDPQAGDTVREPLAAADAPRIAAAPASRSLQLNSTMEHQKERALRAPDDLMVVDDVAALLMVSRAAVYRLVAKHRLPFYRLPGGLRFKSRDVDAYLESRRVDAKAPRTYGRP